MDVGHGGQILVSAMTRALLDGDDLTDLGEYHLKDLTRPERLFQVGTIAFPPLRRTGRLVTLHCVGGVGKTRVAVAVAVARELVERFDVVVFVAMRMAPWGSRPCSSKRGPTSRSATSPSPSPSWILISSMPTGTAVAPH